jgi:hypothetical protein
MLNIIDLYASEYKWSRNEILDGVYIDEYFIQKEIIDKRQRQHYLKLSSISMLESMEKKDRKTFIEELQGDDRPTSVNENQKTDYEAIKQAKAQMNNK